MIPNETVANLKQARAQLGGNVEVNEERRAAQRSEERLYELLLEVVRERVWLKDGRRLADLLPGEAAGYDNRLREMFSEAPPNARKLLVEEALGRMPEAERQKMFDRYMEGIVAEAMEKALGEELALARQGGDPEAFYVTLAGLYGWGDADGEPAHYIGRHLARWAHAVKALAFLKRSDPDHYAHLSHEMKVLRSYWDRPGVTKEQAVAAYNADHPDAPLPILK
jgi:hypothetical protein